MGADGHTKPCAPCSGPRQHLARCWEDWELPSEPCKPSILGEETRARQTGTDGLIVIANVKLQRPGTVQTYAL